jgi:phage terminase Nu1 subunit (DNA packaging protein)
MPKRLNRAETAEHMGVNPTTLDRWVREGCPVAERGSRGIEWQFDLPAVIKWWGNRRADEAAATDTNDMMEIELRTKRAIMLKAELELAKAKGEVASVREFEKVQSKAMAAIRARVMNVPQRVAMRLLGETNETAFKARLSEELRSALESASDSDLSIDEDDDEHPEPV